MSGIWYAMAAFAVALVIRFYLRSERPKPFDGQDGVEKPPGSPHNPR